MAWSSPGVSVWVFKVYDSIIDRIWRTRMFEPHGLRSGALPTSYSANRVLDEPPLIVRTQGFAEVIGQLP